MRCFRALLFSVCVGCLPQADRLLEAIPGTTIRFGLARANFYDARFPSDDLLGEGLDGVPNPDENGYVEDLRTLMHRHEGFGVSSTIYFSATGPLSESLPSIFSNDSHVFLAEVAEFGLGERIPVDVFFDEWGDPLGQ